MAQRKVTDDQLIEAYRRLGSTLEVANEMGMSQRPVAARIAKLRSSGVHLPSKDIRSAFYDHSLNPLVRTLDKNPAITHIDIQNGHVLIGSDSHYWPGIVTTAHNAFLEFCREFKPKYVIKNGDEADFPTISRHAPIQWEKRPSVVDEIDNLKAMLAEIEKVSPHARHIWPLGNHDARFESRLAQVAPEYAKLKGVHLKDHFPKWEACMGTFINREISVRHRPVSGGVYAARNNTMRAGISTVHGHLHSLKVWPHSDYRGTRWGVDCGTMAEPYGPQFEVYTELAPVDWRSGFVLLTFDKGVLLQPEIALVRDKGIVDWRGKLRHV